MSSEPSMLMLWLQTVHGLAVIGWMAGQLCIWRLHAHRALISHAAPLDPLPRVDRRVLRAMTTLAAILSLSTGAVLIAL